MIPNRVKWRDVRDLLLVEKTSLIAPSAICRGQMSTLKTLKHLNKRFFRWVFSTGIPTSSYFLAASNRGWKARRPDLARKFARMGAGRLGG